MATEGSSASGLEAREGIFHDYVVEQEKAGRLIVQPRMGFSPFEEMRAGLEAVCGFDGARIGTITVDSFTRQELFSEAEEALRRGDSLNGFPIVAYGAESTRRLLAGLLAPSFPVQVRHGSPRPMAIFQAAAQAGIDAIEGGPVSYCLPYSRVPLQESIGAWRDACRYWSGVQGKKGHIESFAGCMMGQLCPPALLVALGILEGLFFIEQGIGSISLSYAQGANHDQDLGAVLALQSLAREFVGEHFSHVVVYTFMGVFPGSVSAARGLLADSARISVLGGASRLIVKTPSEAFGIPSIETNVQSLDWARIAAEEARGARIPEAALDHAGEICREARELVLSTLSLAESLEACLLLAFRCGLLDVPYCLHPDNRNAARVVLSPEGVIGWAGKGAAGDSGGRARKFLWMLNYNCRKYSGQPHEFHELEEDSRAPLAQQLMESADEQTGFAQAEG